MKFEITTLEEVLTMYACLTTPNVDNECFRKIIFYLRQTLLETEQFPEALQETMCIAASNAGICGQTDVAVHLMRFLDGDRKYTVGTSLVENYVDIEWYLATLSQTNTFINLLDFVCMQTHNIRAVDQITDMIPAVTRKQQEKLHSIISSMENTTPFEMDARDLIENLL